jgi:hypothetical protein
MVLEVAVGSETEALHDTHNRGGIRSQALGQGADAEEHVFAGMFENRANDFLTFLA